MLSVSSHIKLQDIIYHDKFELRITYSFTLILLNKLFRNAKIRMLDRAGRLVGADRGCTLKRGESYGSSLQYEQRDPCRQSHKSRYLCDGVANKDWLKVDLATDILMTAIWPPAFVRGIKSAFDVVNLLRCATGMGFKALTRPLATSSKEHQAKFAKDAQAARDAIKGHAVKVAPQSSELVNDKAMGKAIVALASFAGVYGGHDIVLKDLANQKDPLKHLLSYTDIINPSTFSSVISAVSDMTMIVATADFSKLTAINTNSDHSWIVTDDMIVRAKYGKLNVEDRDAGYHWFKKQKGMALSGAKGEFLAPDECLEVNVATGKFVLLYEKKPASWSSMTTPGTSRSESGERVRRASGRGGPTHRMTVTSSSTGVKGGRSGPYGSICRPVTRTRTSVWSPCGNSPLKPLRARWSRVRRGLSASGTQSARSIGSCIPRSTFRS